MKKLCLSILLMIFYLGSDAQINVFNTVDLPPGYGGTLIRNNRDFMVDHLGREWLALKDSGVGMFDGNAWIFFNRQNSGLQNDTLYSLTEDASNNIWMGSREGLVKYDGTNWTLYNKANNQLPSDTVTCAAHQGGESWFGTSEGLAHFDGSTWTQFTTANSTLPNDSIQCIDIDTSGYVWIGTISGIYQFDGINFTAFGATANSLPIYDIRALVITINNTVWISGPGETYYLNNSGEFQDLHLICTDSTGPCGITTYSHAACLFADDSLGNVYFSSLNYGTEASIFKITPQLVLSLTANVRKYISNCIQFRIFQNTLYTARVSGRYSCYSSIYTGFCYLSLDSIDFRSKLSFANNLYINHVNARILNRGDLHWDPVTQESQYIVPDCSNKRTVFASAIWIGGIDQTGILHTAAMTYRQVGSIDFFPGPLDTITGQTDTLTEARYDRLWKVNKSTIDDFKINFLNGNVGNGTYPIPESIATWPAEGSGNNTRRLAPYVDYNSDGSYNPNDGDYPKINGDQELWWVFNDSLYRHTESNGPAFGLEIHGEAYAYNCPVTMPQTEVINYTTFYRYTIINRSQNTYDSVKVGLWCDFDFGNALDDYMGCDTMQNTFFVYNGDNDDEGAGSYGLNPPMQSVTILKGPAAYIGDGLDNNHNGIIDENNENSGLSNFVNYIGVATPQGNPAISTDYYYYLNSKWLDGMPITYGGDGRGGGINPTTTPTNFMFSGTPYATPGWTMASGGIPPSDMRGVGSSGTFHLGPGESKTIDFAYIFTRDTTGPNGLYTSVAKNHDDVRRIREWFDAGSPDPCTFLSIHENNSPDKKYCIVNPNPAGERIFLNCSNKEEKIKYIIRDLMGRDLSTGVYSTSGIDISKLPAQVYLIEITVNNKRSTMKFVKDGGR